MWFDESREIKLIELGNNGFNKSVRIRLENITRLKQMLIYGAAVNARIRMNTYLNARSANIMIIDDWHRTKCPNSYISCNKSCPHYKLCSSLLGLSQIKVQYYDSN